MNHVLRTDNIVLQTLRGQDSEIVSLQWTLIESPPIPTPTPTPTPTPLPLPSKQKLDPIHSVSEGTLKVPTPTKSKTVSTAPKSPISDRAIKRANRRDPRREPPKPIVDAGDMFDIHSFDYLEDEFGAISSTSRHGAPTRARPDNDNGVADDDDDGPGDRNKSVTNNENFNFIEECQTLREQMRVGGESNQSESDGGSTAGKRNQVSVNMSDIQDMLKQRGPMADGSIVLSDDNDSGNMASCEIDDLSNRSTIGSSHNTVEIAELEEVIEHLNINDATLSASDPNGFVYLASGAQESNIVIWNTEDGTIVDKIQLKCQGRVKIPSKTRVYSSTHCYLQIITKHETIFSVRPKKTRVKLHGCMDSAK